MFKIFIKNKLKVELAQLISTSDARGAVEKWLLQVEQVMLESVREVIERAREDYPKNIRNDLKWKQIENSFVKKNMQKKAGRCITYV